jgi:opacity protein-like surface antigen
MKRILSAVILLVLAMSGTAFADVAGRYNITGTNFNGSAYYGTVTVTKTSSSTYNVFWYTGENNSESKGIGMRSGNIFSAGYVMGESVGLVIYDIKSDGSLTGRWTIDGQDGVGTEVWTPAR